MPRRRGWCRGGGGGAKEAGVEPRRRGGSRGGGGGAEDAEEVGVVLRRWGWC